MSEVLEILDPGSKFISAKLRVQCAHCKRVYVMNGSPYYVLRSKRCRRCIQRDSKGRFVTP